MRKFIISLVTVAFALSLNPANASLFQYYQERQQQLPTIQERAIEAAEVGIWGYRGTAEQNILLEQRLRDLTPTVSSENLGFSVVSRYKSTLSSSMTSNQLTVPVSSIETFDGHTLTMNDLGGVVYLTIEPGLAREEIVKCTTIASSIWATCTRGLAFYGTSEASVPANQKAHNAGSVVVMSNVHYIYENLIDKSSDQTIAGLLNFYQLPTSTSTATLYNQLFNYGQATSTFVGLTGNQTVAGNKTLSGTTAITGSITVPYSSASSSAASVGFVNEQASAGCANADEATKGCTELATREEAAAGTSTGSTGARLSLPASMATSTSQVATTSLVMTNTSGKIDTSFLQGLTKQIITTTGTSTFAVPAGVSRVYVEIVAGGGAGAGTSGDDSVGGGGAGGYSYESIDVSATSTIQYFVGTAGQWTTFGTNGFYLSANPGTTAAGQAPGTGGTSTGGDLNIPGGSGHVGGTNIVGIGGNGGSSMYGFGGAGGAGNNSNGQDGVGYGSGGGGASDESSGTQNGGAGRQGILIITY